MEQIKNTQILVKNRKILEWKFEIDQKTRILVKNRKVLEWKFEIDKKYTNFSEKY